MTKLKAILVSIGLIIATTLLGHYIPPTSIFITPVIIGGITALLSMTTFRVYFIILFILIVIFLNDILIKLSAGGISDFEGAGLINLFFIFGVIVSTIIALISLFYSRKRNRVMTIFLCLLIPVASYFYIPYFDFLGLIDHENASLSEQISKKKDVFISDLKFSQNQVAAKNDTLNIIGGWSEKQIIVDHTHLIKKYDDTSTINYIIKLNGNKKIDSLEMRYNVNDTTITYSSPVDSIINFSLPKSTHNIILTFFKTTDKISSDTIIKKVIVNSK